MGPDAWSYWAEIGQGFVGAIRLLVTGDPETWAIIRQSLLISISATLASMVLGVLSGGEFCSLFATRVLGFLRSSLA